MTTQLYLSHHIIYVSWSASQLVIFFSFVLSLEGLVVTFLSLEGLV